MHTNLPLRILALLAVSIATLSLASGAAAQEEVPHVATECGSGRVDPCGEKTTYTCEWSWGWQPWYAFPYVMPVPKYECEVALKDLMYRNSTRGEIRIPDQ